MCQGVGGEVGDTSSIQTRRTGDRHTPEKLSWVAARGRCQDNHMAQLCLLPSVPTAGLFACWLPKQGEGQDILEEVVLFFLICPRGTTVGSFVGQGVPKAFKDN